MSILGQRYFERRLAPSEARSRIFFLVARVDLLSLRVSRLDWYEWGLPEEGT